MKNILLLLLLSSQLFSQNCVTSCELSRISTCEEEQEKVVMLLEIVFQKTTTATITIDGLHYAFQQRTFDMSNQAMLTIPIFGVADGRIMNVELTIKQETCTGTFRKTFEVQMPRCYACIETNNVADINTDLYKDAEEIIITAKINAYETVELEAETIIFRPGFHARRNSILNTKIQTCEQ